jgi:hypothetical protein
MRIRYSFVCAVVVILLSALIAAQTMDEKAVPRDKASGVESSPLLLTQVAKPDTLAKTLPSR